MTEEQIPSVKLERVEWWIRVAQSLGVPTIILGFLIFGLYNAGAWLGANIIFPLFEKQIQFIERTEQAVVKTELAVTEMARVMANYDDRSTAIEQVVKATLTQTAENRELILQSQKQTIENSAKEILVLKEIAEKIK